MADQPTPDPNLDLLHDPRILATLTEFTRLIARQAALKHQQRKSG